MTQGLIIIGGLFMCGAIGCALGNTYKNLLIVIPLGGFVGYVFMTGLEKLIGMI